MPKPSLNQRVGIVYNPDKDRARQECSRLKKWFLQRKIKTVVGTDVSPSMRGCRFVVALGGDGTVLKAARGVAAWNVPVLGVNVGRLGFLAATEVGAMNRTIARVLAGQGRLETRSMISVRGTSRGRNFGPHLALNDAVLRSGSTGRVLLVQAYVREKLLAHYRGDGLIISTATGSTAYNLAASGPIVYPDVDAFIMSPICPHSLSQRPLVMPTFEIIRMEVGRPSPEALLSIDGHVVEKMGPGDRAEVKRAVEQVQLLMDPDRSYYQVLQNKLKWGGS